MATKDQGSLEERNRKKATDAYGNVAGRQGVPHRGAASHSPRSRRSLKSLGEERLEKAPGVQSIA